MSVTPLPCVSRSALTLSLGLCAAATQAILSMRTEQPATVSLRANMSIQNGTSTHASG